MKRIKEYLNKNGWGCVYICVFQICSLLPLPYMLISTGYMGLFAKRSLLSVLFDLGTASLPRAEALALSLLYRKTASEIAVYFALAALAFFYGILMKKLLHASPKTAGITKTVLLCLLAADLILRVLPFSFNLAFGWGAAVFGFALRALCLAMLAADLCIYKKTANKQSRRSVRNK